MGSGAGVASGSGVVSDLNDPGGGAGAGQVRNPTIPKHKDGKKEEEKSREEKAWSVERQKVIWIVKY